MLAGRERADIAAADRYGDTPLHSRAAHWRGEVGVLLQLGADPQAESRHGTPLHAAAGSCNTVAATGLLQHGARVNAYDREGHTPLAYALQRCDNVRIPRMAAFAELLLGAGAERTPEMTGLVGRIGANFEFHRAAFNADLVDEVSVALDKLYSLFDTAHAPRRIHYDGTSPIVATSARWQDQHYELWQLLVPSSGAASTVQGEVVRISGRIQIELDDNGGVNWDVDYRKMADALLAHVGSGAPLPKPFLSECRVLVADLKRKHGDPRRLCEFAVLWVSLNPNPMRLPPPDYKR